MNNELIYGSEPYLIRTYKEEIIKDLQMPDFNLLITEQFAEQERDFTRQMPFCNNRRVIILQLEKLSSNELLEAYLKSPTMTTDLYIFVHEVDKRTSVYKQFPKQNIKVFDKNPELLQRWILGYVKKRHCKITRQAYDELVSRINYDLDEVNMYHVRTALKRLCTTQEEITPDLVKKLVVANEKEDIFELIRLIDEKRMLELFHEIELIIQHGNQNIIGTLSLLLRSYRIVYKVNVCGCSLKDIGVYYKTYIPKLAKHQADAGVQIIQEFINGIKNGTYSQEMALRMCISKLCQM